MTTFRWLDLPVVTAALPSGGLSFVAGLVFEPGFGHVNCGLNFCLSDRLKMVQEEPKEITEHQ